MDWAMHFDKQDRKKKAMEQLFQSSQKPTSSQSAQKPKPSPNNPFRQYATPATAAATPASASNSNSQQSDGVPMEIDSGWKTVRPPRQCYNCQGYGHIARDCKKPKASHSQSVNNISMADLVKSIKGELKKDKDFQ